MNGEKQETVISKSAWQSGWDNFAEFIKEAFIKTPFETIFEVGLLVAGGSRTINFLTGMGQSGWIATIALIYAEVGLVFMEFLGYRGKRVQYDYVDRKGKHYKAYPFINQKSLAKFGLWGVHIPMTVFFTGSDIIKSNLETLATKSGIEATGGFDAGFAWALGFVIALAFFLDLVIIINYKASNPETKHQEEMNQLLHDKEQWSLEKQRIEAQATLDYERMNGAPLAKVKAKFNARKEIISEFSKDLGADYVEAELQEVDLSPRKVKEVVVPEQPKEEESQKRPYNRTGNYSKFKFQEKKTQAVPPLPEPEVKEEKVEQNFPVEGETIDREKLETLKNTNFD